MPLETDGSPDGAPGALLGTSRDDERALRVYTARRVADPMIDMISIHR